MNRRRSLAALASLAAAGALPVRSQPAPRIPHVAILFFGSRANFASRADAFTKAMAELGYVEGKNIAFDWRTANGQEDLLATYANEIGRSGVDVVLSASTHTSRALKVANVPQPVVMAATEDAVAEGFARSPEKPGGTMTGIASASYELIDRHVELLFAVAPRLTRITALLNPLTPTYRAYRGRLQSAVRAGTKLIVVDASSIEQIEAAFPARARDDADGLIVMNDVLLYNERRTVVESAARARRPAVYPLRGFVEAGGLMSWGPNNEANFVRAAGFVARILKGARPGDLPMEAPAKLELVVNRETLRNLSLELPPELAKQALPIGR